MLYLILLPVSYTHLDVYKRQQLYYNDNQQIQNSITSSLTLVSKSILISSTVMSEDQSQPIIDDVEKIDQLKINVVRFFEKS